jgi:acetyl esterase/lipase
MIPNHCCHNWKICLRLYWVDTKKLLNLKFILISCIKSRRFNLKRPFSAFCVVLIALSTQAQPFKDTSIRYVHQDKPGCSVQILKAAARIFLNKNSISEKLSKDHFVSTAAIIPGKIIAGFNVDTSLVNGRKVYQIAPKGKKSGKYVVFLHGGGYINNIFRQHWKFAARIVRQTNCTFIIPDYPLAPASTFEEAFAMLDAIYKNLLIHVAAKDIILMGDSAGGGLALALAQKQKKDGITQSARLILISPWLDVTMSNPEIKEVQKKDVSLRADNLVMAGKAWAGKSDPENYLVSPVNGSLEGLPKISIFIGTHDILYPDCQKLKGLLEQKGIAMNFFEYPKMFHDWVMLVSLKESEKAISQISDLIVE